MVFDDRDTYRDTTDSFWRKPSRIARWDYARGEPTLIKSSEKKVELNPFCQKHFISPATLKLSRFSPGWISPTVSQSPDVGILETTSVSLKWRLANVAICQNRSYKRFASIFWDSSTFFLFFLSFLLSRGVSIRNWHSLFLSFSRDIWRLLRLWYIFLWWWCKFKIKIEDYNIEFTIKRSSHKSTIIG